MDFFRHQDAARTRSRLLVIYYIAAVAAIVLLVYAAAVAIFVGGAQSDRRGAYDFSAAPAYWQPELFLFVAVATLTIIVGGTVWKLLTLSGDGAAVARALGGREIEPATADPGERRLVNVVEEMALASGTQVPRLFLIDDQSGINAFAAGTSPNRASIGVTRAALEQLSRDELQGVIAHEFSHILNGDMRLNIRLIGVLHGILLLYIIGRETVSALSRGRRVRRSSDKGGAGAAVLFGVALCVIGLVGVFFANLIKSAISRQREYLADASAVQFTRNPDGIGGALKKIGGFAAGGRISSPAAEQASHMFFADGVSNFFAGFSTLFATHPPLEQRILRILPDFDGDFTIASESPEMDAVAAFAPATSGAVSKLTPEEVVRRVGTVQREGLQLAGNLLRSLPADLVETAHRPLGAAAVIIALLCRGEVTDAHSQVIASVSPELLAQVLEIQHPIAELEHAARLPLLDLSIPALRQLDPALLSGIESAAGTLARLDRSVSVTEYLIISIIRGCVADVRGGARRSASSRGRSARDLLAPAATVLSALSHQGSRSQSAAQNAFVAAMREYAGDVPVELIAQDEGTLESLDSALSELNQADSRVKRRLLAAAAAAVLHDRDVTVEEAELIRAFSESIDCPLPPLTVF